MGAWLVEDDPYGELRYEGAVQPSLLEMSAAPTAATTVHSIFIDSGIPLVLKRSRSGISDIATDSRSPRKMKIAIAHYQANV